jgi:hypothetical protein
MYVILCLTYPQIFLLCLFVGIILHGVGEQAGHRT